MDDQLARLEAKIQHLEGAVAALNQRVGNLENGVRGTASRDASDLEPDGAAAEVAGGSDVSAYLTLVGRTFMVFGGAFLLRALTDSGKLPRGAGIAMGLAYACVWFVAADRASGVRRFSSIFHGIAGVAIGYPLLWEASTRFAFLSPPAAATALAALTALAFAVAWHHRQESLAGLALLGALLTTLGLIRATGQFVPFGVLVTLIGLATLWLGYDRDWHWLRWPAALVADAVVTAMALRGVSDESVTRAGAVIGVQILLFAAYAGSVVLRSTVRRRVVVPFEIIQTLAAFAVGFGGAVAVARASGAGEAGLGVAGGLLAIASYGAALACWRSQQKLAANFYFYAALALVLSLTAGAVLLNVETLAITMALLAAFMAWLAGRVGQPGLLVCSAVYLIVAAVGSGLLQLALHTLVLSSSADWLVPGVAAWLTLIIIALCVAGPPVEAKTVPAVVEQLPRLVLASLLLFGGSAVTVAHLTPIVAGVPPDAGVLATLRTAVLSIAAVLLAGATRYRRTTEIGWLLYPLLAMAGLKLALEDFRHSEPATLFLALGLFGAALLAAARLVRRKVVA